MRAAGAGAGPKTGFSCTADIVPAGQPGWLHAAPTTRSTTFSHWLLPGARADRVACGLAKSAAIPSSSSCTAAPRHPKASTDASRAPAPPRPNQIPRPQPRLVSH